MHKEPITQCTSMSLLSSISLGFLCWNTTCTERMLKKGETGGHEQPVTCSLCYNVICMCYTSFAPQQEGFRARTLRATTAAPPHAVQSWLYVNLAAEKGVCSDVNATSRSLTIIFHLPLIHIVMRRIQASRGF